VTVRSACVAAASTLAIATTAGGCGGGSDKPAYCDDRAALEQSLEDLRGFDVRSEGLDALAGELRGVQADANALVRSTREQFRPEADALRSGIAALGDSVRQAASAPSTDAVATVAADVSAVAAAFGRLSDELGADC
jgi:hypothetical protein